MNFIADGVRDLEGTFDLENEVGVVAEAVGLTHAEVHATPFHIKGAYDVLVEVENSSWAAEIRQLTPSPWDSYWTLRHYLIYVDSDGSYEILADSYSVQEIE